MGALLLWIAVAAVLIFPGIYGLILAFKASLILGIIVLVVEPSPTIIGWLAIFGYTDICQKVVDATVKFLN